MNIPNLIEALQIFSKYTIKPDCSWIEASHDQLYVQSMDSLINEQDLSRLAELGWFQDGGIEIANGEQSMEDAWTCYT